MRRLRHVIKTTDTSTCCWINWQSCWSATGKQIYCLLLVVRNCIQDDLQEIHFIASNAWTSLFSWILASRFECRKLNHLKAFRDRISNHSSLEVGNHRKQSCWPVRVLLDSLTPHHHHHHHRASEKGADLYSGWWCTVSSTKPAPLKSLFSLIESFCCLGADAELISQSHKEVR